MHGDAVQHRQQHLHELDPSNLTAYVIDKDHEDDLTYGHTTTSEQPGAFLVTCPSCQSACSAPVSDATLTPRPAPSGAESGATPSPGATPTAPTVAPSPIFTSLTPQRYEQMSRNMHAATRDLVNGVDAGLMVLTTFISLFTSWKRAAGCMTYDEANELITAAEKPGVSSSDRQILAASLAHQLNQHAIMFVSYNDRSEEEAEAKVRAFIAAHPTMDSGELRLGALLSAGDMLINRAHSVFLSVATARPGVRAPTMTELAEARTSFEAALAAVPTPLKETARNYVRTALEAENHEYATAASIESLRRWLERGRSRDLQSCGRSRARVDCVTCSPLVDTSDQNHADNWRRLTGTTTITR